MVLLWERQPVGMERPSAVWWGVCALVLGALWLDAAKMVVAFPPPCVKQKQEYCSVARTNQLCLEQMHCDPACVWEGCLRAVGGNSRLHISIVSHHHCVQGRPPTALLEGSSSEHTLRLQNNLLEPKCAPSRVHYLVQAVLFDLNGIVMGAQSIFNKCGKFRFMLSGITET